MVQSLAQQYLLVSGRALHVNLIANWIEDGSHWPSNRRRHLRLRDLYSDVKEGIIAQSLPFGAGAEARHATLRSEDGYVDGKG